MQANDENDSKQSNIQVTDQIQKQKLSKADLDKLLKRLSHDTKKDFETKAQIEKVRKTNIEVKK